MKQSETGFAKVLDYLNSHKDQPIVTDKIVKASGTSRSYASALLCVAIRNKAKIEKFPGTGNSTIFVVRDTITRKHVADLVGDEPKPVKKSKINELPKNDILSAIASEGIAIRKAIDTLSAAVNTNTDTISSMSGRLLDIELGKDK